MNRKAEDWKKEYETIAARKTNSLGKSQGPLLTQALLDKTNVPLVPVNKNAVVPNKVKI